MVHVDASVNHGHNARAANSKTVLSVLKPDDLGRGLRRIAMPNDGAVVLHRGLVITTRGNGGEWRLRDGQEVVGLNAHDPQQGFRERECPVHKVCEKIVGRCYQKVLADRAVQATLDLTLEEIAEIQNGG